MGEDQRPETSRSIVIPPIADTKNTALTMSSDVPSTREEILKIDSSKLQHAQMANSLDVTRERAMPLTVPVSTASPSRTRDNDSGLDTSGDLSAHNTPIRMRQTSSGSNSSGKGGGSQKRKQIIDYCALEAIGSCYTGEIEDNPSHVVMDGFGRYTFSNGNYYVGQFHDNAFHGEGSLFFTDTKGKFVGVWEAGRVVRGQYYFRDHLTYAEKEWAYCSPEVGHRMFWSELTDGAVTSLEGGGGGNVTTHETDGSLSSRAARIGHRLHGRAPKGSYDCGDGWYDENVGHVYSFESNVYLRTPDATEVEWIKSKCAKM